jgi:hypothetical protein
MRDGSTSPLLLVYSRFRARDRFQRDLARLDVSTDWRMKFSATLTNSPKSYSVVVLGLEDVVFEWQTIFPHNFRKHSTCRRPLHADKTKVGLKDFLRCTFTRQEIWRVTPLYKYEQKEERQLIKLNQIKPLKESSFGYLLWQTSIRAL